MDEQEKISVELEVKYQKALDSINQFQNQMKKALSTTNIKNDNFKNMANDVNNTSKSINNLKKGIDGLLKSIQSMNNSLGSLSKIGEVINKSLGSLGNVGNLMVKSVSSGTSRLNSMFRNVGSKLGKFLSDGFAKEFISVSKKISSSFSNIGKSLSKSLGPIRSITSGLTGMIKLAYRFGMAMDNRKVSKSLKNVNDQIRANTQAMDEFMRKGIESTHNVITNSAKAVRNIMDLPGKINENWDGISTSLKVSLNEAKNIITKDKGFNIKPTVDSGSFTKSLNSVNKDKKFSLKPTVDSGSFTKALNSILNKAKGLIFKPKVEPGEFTKALNSINRGIENTKKKFEELSNIVPRLKQALSIRFTKGIETDLANMNRYIAETDRRIESFKKSTTGMEKIQTAFSALSSAVMAGLSKVSSMLKQFVITKFLQPKKIKKESEEIARNFPGGKAVIGLFKTSLNNLINLLKKTASTINSIMHGIASSMGSVCHRIVGVFKSLGNGIRSAVNGITNIIKGLFGIVKPIMTGAGRITVTVVNSAYNAMPGQQSKIATSYQGAVNTVASGISPQMGAVTSMFTARIFEAGAKLRDLGLVSSQVYYLIKSNWSKIAQVGNSIGSQLKSTAGKLVEPLRQIFTNIKANFNIILGNLKTSISQIGGGLFSGLKNVVTTVGGILGGLSSSIGTLVNVINRVTTIFMTFGQQVVSVGTILVNMFKPAIEAVVLTLKTIGTIFSPLRESIAPVANLLVSLGTAVGTLVKSIMTFASAILTGPLEYLITGISKAINWLSNKLSSVLNKVTSGCEKFINFINKATGREVSNDSTEESYDGFAEESDYTKAVNRMVDEITQVASEVDDSADIFRPFNEALKKATETLNNLNKTKFSNKENTNFENPFENMKIPNPFEDMKIPNPFEGVKNPFKGIKNPFEGVKNPFVNIGKTLDSVMGKVGRYSILVNKIRNPFQTLRAELAKRAIDSVNASAIKTVNSFTKLRASINQFRTASGAFNKLKAGIDVLKKGVTTGFNAIVTTLKAKSLDKAINKMKKPTEKASKELSKCVPGGSKTIGLFKNALSKLLGLFGVYQIYNLVKKSINAAMSAIESENLFEVSMTNNAAAGEKFAKEFGLTAYDVENKTKAYTEAQKAYQKEMQNNIDAATEFKNAINSIYGTNMATLNNLMSGFSNLANGIGYTTKAQLQMSKSLTMLSQDMASFFNKNTEDVANDLNAIFTGQYETLRKYGIVLNETILKQNAARFGIKLEEGDTLTQAQKSLIAYNLVLEKTKTSQGDLARTMDSPANAVRRLKEEFKTLATAIGSMFLPIIQVVVPVISNVVKNLTVMAGQLAKVTQKLMAPFMPKKKDTSQAEQLNKDAYQTIKANEAIGASYDLMGGAAEDYADTAKKSSNDAKKAMNSSLAPIDEINQLSRDQSSSNEDIDNALSTMAEIPSLGLEVDNALAETEEEVNELSSSFIDMVKKSLEPFMDAWDNMEDWFMSKVNRFKESFSNLSESISQLMEDIYNNGGERLIQLFAEIGIAIGGAFLGIGSTIMDAVAEIAEYLSPETNPITKNFIAALETMLEKTRDFIMFLEEWFRDLWEGGLNDVVMGFVDGMMGIGTALANVFSGLIDTVQEVLDYLNPINNEFIATFLEKTGEFLAMLGDLAQAVGDAFSFLLDNGLTDTLKILGDVLGILGGALMDVLKWITGLVIDFVNSWLFQGILKLLGGLLQGIAKVLKWLAEIIVVAVEWVMNLLDAIFDLIGGALEPLKGALGGIKDAWTNVIDWFKGIPDFFKNLGKNIMTGLTNGIKSFIFKPIYAIKNVGTTIKNTFKKLFGINSPSKVFEEYGVFTMDGFTIGIDSQKSTVINDLSNMSNTISENAKKSFKGLSDQMTNPFNRAVTTLSDMSKDVNDMFDFEVGVDMKGSLSYDKVLSITSQTSQSLSRAAAELDANKQLTEEEQVNIKNVANVSATFDYDRLARSILSATDKNIIIELDKRELGKATINSINADTKINGKCRIRK